METLMAGMIVLLFPGILAVLGEKQEDWQLKTSVCLLAGLKGNGKLHH